MERGWAALLWAVTIAGAVVALAAAILPHVFLRH